MKIKTLLTTLAIGGLLCISAHAQCCAPSAAANNKVTAKPTAATDGSAVTLKVTGMTCEMCAKGVTSALQKIAGVKTANVSWDKSQAIVTMDAAKVKTEQLIAAVDKAGGDRHTFKAEKAEVKKQP